MDIGSILLAILAIGVLIIFHEAGHFWAAKWSGMSVSTFSVGFGPPIAKFERGGTQYQIGLLPLGGYVQIDGMSPEDGTDPDAPGSYQNKAFHKKFATILAGPVANYVLAFFLVAMALMAFRSTSLPPIRILAVQEGSAAATAGLKVGDLLVGTPAGEFEEVDELVEVIAASHGAPIHFDVVRDGEQIQIPVTPLPFSGGGFRIGVSHVGEREAPLPGLSLGAALGASAEMMWTWSRGFVNGLASIVDIRQLQGPIGIVKSLSKSVSRSGTGALPFIAQISVVLGVANLMPIPGLDGSRLLFMIVGAVRKKPIPPKLEAIIHTVGVILLLLMLLVVSIKDVLM